MAAPPSRFQWVGGELLAPCLFLFLADAVASNVDWYFLNDCLGSAVDSFLLPSYAALVALYLTGVVFAPQLEPLFLGLRRLASYAQLLRSQKGPPAAVTATAPPVAEVPAGLDTAPQPFDLSGAYLLEENRNYEAFLAVQGVPRMYRSMADKARPVHRITHRGRVVTIRIEGLIESQTTYIVDGPPVRVDVRGRIFEDTMRYLEGGDDRRGIVVHKRAVGECYSLTVQRELSPDGREIVMTSRATFEDGREPVECVQLFRRIE